MNLIIKTIDNKKYEFIVESKDTIMKLKYQINKKLNYEVEQQRLLFQGSSLLNEKTIEESNIKNNSHLFLLITIL
jgi:hypothetical protein